MNKIFLKNKFTEDYFLLIEKARSRNIFSKEKAKEVLGYCEKHHIIPVSLKGKNTKDNLVFLTPKEHFIAHRLLTKMCISKKDEYKMLCAFDCLRNYKSKFTLERYCPINEDEYSELKIHLSRVRSEIYSGKNNPNFENYWSLEKKKNFSKRRLGKNNPSFGRKRPEQSKLMMGNKIAKTLNTKHIHNKEKLLQTRIKPEEIQQYLSEGWELGELKYLCEYCQKSYTKGNYSRWHENNCSLNPNKSINKIECINCSKLVDERVFNSKHGKNCKLK